MKNVMGKKIDSKLLSQLAKDARFECKGKHCTDGETCDNTQQKCCWDALMKKVEKKVPIKKSHKDISKFSRNSDSLSLIQDMLPKLSMEDLRQVNHMAISILNSKSRAKAMNEIAVFHVGQKVRFIKRSSNGRLGHSLHGEIGVIEKIGVTKLQVLFKGMPIGQQKWTVPPSMVQPVK